MKRPERSGPTRSCSTRGGRITVRGGASTRCCATTSKRCSPSSSRRSEGAGPRRTRDHGVSDASPTRHSGRYGAWIPGLALIGLGIIFLIQNYLGREIHNWWALFIVLPVFSTLERGRASLQAGRPGEAIGQLLAALVLNALIVILLFDLPLGQIWPVLLIISGFSLLVWRRGWAV